MTTSKKLSVIFLFLFCAFPFFSEENKWFIGGTKFVTPSSQADNTLTKNLAEILPINILGKLSSSIERNVMPDEKYQRESFKLHTERQSLYLQLTSEYKKRDALVLSKNTDFSLKSEIKAAEKRIKEIEKKLNENLEKDRKKETEADLLMKIVSPEDVDDDDEVPTEGQLYKNLFKNFFKNEENYFGEEQIGFYGNNEMLFTPSDNIAKLEYTNSRYEKAVVNAGINALLTGKITNYGNYLSVSVDLYNYPGSKLLGSVLEVGTMEDMDLLTSSIARQLLPYIANAMPVEFNVIINPPEAAKSATIYIDDVLQVSEKTKYVIDSGIHRVQFIAPGYQSAGTTYYFEGNTKYNIEVDFKETKLGYIQIGLRNNIEGDFYLNGQKALRIENTNPIRTQIAINGKVLLGEFVTESGETAFFYIPEKQTIDKNYVTVKPKPKDRMAYIDTRRKWMYGAYTLFMISLMPAFYTYGNYQNHVDLYRKKLIDYETAKNWQNASLTCEIISIGLGVFWGFELIRYLVAANSVLPQYSRQGKSDQFIFYDIQQTEVPEDIEKIETGETENEDILQ